MDEGLVNSLDGNGLECYGLEGVFEMKRYESCVGVFERESMSHAKKSWDIHLSIEIKRRYEVK